MSIQWKGVMPAVTTKFDQNDELDLAAFEKNIKAQLEAGVTGIILGGTLGEASTLTVEEKEILVTRTKEIVKGRVPIILNIAEQSTKDAIAAAQGAEGKAVDGLMVLPPMRYKATDRETLVYFQEIARSVSLPIMIYNNPVDYKIEVTLEMLEVLVQEPNIQAIKESTRDISNVTRIRNRFGDRIKIFPGVDTLAFECLVAGADGWVAGTVCAYPEETVAIYQLVKAGRIEEALEIHRWYMPVLELDISPQLVQNIKLAEAVNGLGTENVRAPRLPLEGEERKRVLGIIEKANDQRPVLPNYKSLSLENTTT